jgi:hypothetical protein
MAQRKILLIDENQSPFKAAWANTGCTERLGLGAFLEFILSYSSFPFPNPFLPSRTPKGYNANR